jgi:hypothetical protein
MEGSRGVSGWGKLVGAGLEGGRVRRQTARWLACAACIHVRRRAGGPRRADAAGNGGGEGGQWGGGGTEGQVAREAAERLAELEREHAALKQARPPPPHTLPPPHTCRRAAYGVRASRHRAAAVAAEASAGPCALMKPARGSE